MRSTLNRVCLFPLVVVVAACGSLSNPLGQVKPYKADIQQGNVVTPDMTAKLKIGMTVSQVRFLLGTPLITDPFHPNRWDYFYRATQGGHLTAQQRVTVVFENEKLARVEGLAMLPNTVTKPAAVEPARTEAPNPVTPGMDKK